jgi:hypothetical protein
LPAQIETAVANKSTFETFLIFSVFIAALLAHDKFAVWQFNAAGKPGLTASRKLR